MDKGGLLLPERADSPFISLAVQMYTRIRIELHVVCAHVSRFLYACSGVVEEDQQSSITQRMTPTRRQSGKRGLDLIALHEDGFGRSGSLSWNTGYLSGLFHSFRALLADICKKCADDRQSLIARLNHIASAFFEGIQKL